MRIVVTGCNGQVARCLVEAGNGSDATVIAIGRPHLDLCDEASILPALREAEPDVVVSAAAYTAVDQAEREKEMAFLVNSTGAGAVADAAATLGVPLIHLSTDYVYDGLKADPYVESDETNPINVYGASKLAGEERVRSRADHLILRTSWVYSVHARNFVKTMAGLSGKQSLVRVVADQRGAPTSADDIARSVMEIARRLHTSSDRSLRGVFHLSGGGEASWADIAEAIFDHLGRKGAPVPTLERIETSQFPTPARRPLNSRLDTSRLAATYGIELPHWRRSLQSCLNRLPFPESP